MLLKLHVLNAKDGREDEKFVERKYDIFGQTKETPFSGGNFRSIQTVFGQFGQTGPFWASQEATKDNFFLSSPFQIPQHPPSKAFIGLNFFAIFLHF